MKAMKLYDHVDRIHRELAALDIDGDAPLTVEQLTPFDHYHYLGTEAVDRGPNRPPFVLLNGALSFETPKRRRPRK